MSKPENITIPQVEKIIQTPSKEWMGRCAEISTLFLTNPKCPIKGKPQYGFYYGPVSELSIFNGKSLIRHGWIKLADSRIFDLTRWVFDNPDNPYVYCENNEDDYDMGMNRFKEQFVNRPVPEFCIEDKTKRFKTIPEVLDFIEILGIEGGDRNKDSMILSINQLFWLANLPIQLLGDYAKPIYEGFIEIGMSGFVPLDNRLEVGL